MKKQLVIIGIAVLLICVGLSGCNGIFRDSRFIGTWKLSEGPGTFSTIVLNTDKTAILKPGSYTCTWEIDNDRLIFHLDMTPQYVPTYDYEFKDDNTLILSLVGHDIPVTYLKQ